MTYWLGHGGIRSRTDLQGYEPCVPEHLGHDWLIDLRDPPDSRAASKVKAYPNAEGLLL